MDSQRFPIHKTPVKKSRVDIETQNVRFIAIAAEKLKTVCLFNPTVYIMSNIRPYNIVFSCTATVHV